MGLEVKIAVILLCAVLVLGIIRLFAAPLKLALKLILNTLLGFLALFLLSLTAPLTGFALGPNLFNALVIGILGVPGLVLLVLLQAVFI